jgi:8-oxo-dGTP pyrophosphatase MutT (NUDIX family)
MPFLLMSRALQLLLSEKLTLELPGEKAHLEAAPFRRTRYAKDELSKARESAVLVLCYQKNKETYIALIQRPKYDGAHSGQIALPGGKVEKSDKNIVHTALREANEEIGVIIKDVEVVGQLTQIYIPVSNFKVIPVIGCMDYCPDFVLDQREVAELIELKLSDLIAVKELSETKITFSDTKILKTPCFNFNDKIVWGATAIILNEMRWLLRGDK